MGSNVICHSRGSSERARLSSPTLCFLIFPIQHQPMLNRVPAKHLLLQVFTKYWLNASALARLACVGYSCASADSDYNRGLLYHSLAVILQRSNRPFGIEHSRTEQNSGEARFPVRPKQTFRVWRFQYIKSKRHQNVRQKPRTDWYRPPPSRCVESLG